MAAPKVLFYSPDSFGLGHFRRSLTIAEALARNHPGIQMLCMTGSPRPDMFELPDGFDTIKLPSITKNDNGEYESVAGHLDLSQVAHLRTSLVHAAIQEFSPDVFIVDHSPFGTLGELLPVLTAMRKKDRILTIFGMRDIVDSPERLEREWTAQGVLEGLDSLFDHILVYADPLVYDSRAEYGLERIAPGKSHLTGIVCRCPPCKGARGFRDGRPSTALVTTGGGKDGMHIIEAALAALPADFHKIRVITGPLSKSSALARIEKRVAADPRVSLLRESHQMCDELCDYDLVIGMVGYNTAYEVVRARKAYVAVPREGPRLEQRLRAERLSALGLAVPVGSDPSGLEKRLRDACKHARSPLERLPRFDGADQASDLVVGWLGGRGVQPPRAAGKAS